MRAIVTILLGATLLSGCAPGSRTYVRNAPLQETTRPIDVEDRVELTLKNGRVVSGTVQWVRDDSLGVSGTVVYWADVEVVKTTPRSSGADLVVVSAVTVAVVVIAVLASSLADADFGR